MEGYRIVQQAYTLNVREQVHVLYSMRVVVSAGLFALLALTKP